MQVRAPSPRVGFRAALAVALAALLCFGLVAIDLWAGGPLSTSDAAGLALTQALHHAALTPLMAVGSTLHSTPALLVATAVAGSVLASWRAWRWLVLLVCAVPGAMLLNAGVKLLFARPRPPWQGAIEDQLTTFSFPSGHTAGAVAWWGFVALFVWTMDSRAGVRWAVAAFGVGAIVLASVSRVYLGHHFASDTVAAAFEGIAWLAACVALAVRHEHR